jgi:RimJ/RimL family protein N-acetyltransferase
MRSLHMKPSQVLQSLVRQYRFNPYRAYRAFSRRVQSDVLIAETSNSGSGAGASIHVAENGAAAVVARRLSWDSSFFRTPMARIEHVFGEDDSAKRHALEACLDFFREDGIRHVAANIDAADIGTAALLERQGFCLAGGAVTYTARPHIEPPRPVRKRGRIRNLRAADEPEVIAIAQESFRGLRGRFHFDATLPQDAVDSFYTEWARRCVAYEMADTVLVAEGPDGRLLGFIAFRRREPVSTISGVAIFGGGLGACRRDAGGAYLGLLHAGVTWAHNRGGMVEVQTQNHNAPAISVYEAVGLRCRRANYNFHLSLGDQAVE